MRADVVVIGGGGAGLTSAVVAAENGCRVVLIDSGFELGGQYFRHSKNTTVLPKDWQTFVEWQKRVQVQQAQGNLTYLSRTTVWSLSPDGDGFVVRATKGERTKEPVEVQSARLVIATGAHDRALPYSGWTLPGNYTVGAIQSLVKGHNVLAGQRIVLGGTGPFLLAAAASVIEAGGQVVAVIEANRFTAMAKYPRALLAGRDKLGLALHYLSTLRRQKVQLLQHGRIVQANALHGRVNSVEVMLSQGRQTIECDAVGTGFGFNVNLELATALGLELTTTPDKSLAVKVSDEQTTSHPYVFAAGEATGIAGIDAALVEGQISGWAVAHSLGRDVSIPVNLLKLRTRLHTFADYLARAYPLEAHWVNDVSDDTLLCRCEEVSAGAIRAAISEYGANDTRSAKLFTRAGMGWCQGRMCARVCSEFISQHTGVDSLNRDLQSAAKRSIVTPVPLGTVATWSDHHH